MQPSSSPCDSPDTEVVDGGMDHVVSCSPEIVAHMDLHGAIVEQGLGCPFDKLRLNFSS